MLPRLGLLLVLAVSACSVPAALVDSGQGGPDLAAGPSDAGGLDGGGGDSGGDGPALPPPAVGANMPNLLAGFLGLAPGGPAAMRAQLDEAQRLGVRHVRIIGSLYWPSEMTKSPGWVADPAAYFAGFDALVAEAKARQIRLVPSLLWHLFLFPDLAGEPLSKLFVPGSKTRVLAERYVTEVVSRYAGEDTIAFWEIGNEHNLLADLDQSTCDACDGKTSECGSLVPTLGTPCRRTAADNFFSCNACRGVSSAQEDLGAFGAAMAALIHGLDPGKLVSSGHAYPRPSAWHLGQRPCPACDWTADTRAEYAQALAQLHPAGVDVVSVHHYPEGGGRFGSGDGTLGELVAATVAWARGAGKHVYVGEHGEPRAGEVSCGGTVTCGGDATQGQSRFHLAHFAEHGVRWSALWALDFFQFCEGVPTCFTVTHDEPLAAALPVHQAALGACASQPDGTACPLGACAAGACRPQGGGRFGFDAPGDEAAFTVFTNCTGCAPGSASRAAAGGGGALRLTSHDLPCTGACQYPGLYALGPEVPLPLGHALVRATTRTAAAGATLLLIPFDAAGQELAHLTVPLPASPDWQTTARFAPLPAGAAKGRLRLQLTTPDATLEVDELGVATEP